MLTIVLVEPKIPQNAGNVARLCAATGTPLHFVGTLGFELSDRYLKRAGLDYWPWVTWQHFPNLTDYFSKLKSEKIHLFSTKASRHHFDQKINDGDTLIFGSETEGLPEIIRKQFSERCVRIPMLQPNVRSLNLSTSVGIALYEGLRQTGLSTLWQ